MEIEHFTDGDVVAIDETVVVQAKYQSTIGFKLRFI